MKVTREDGFIIEREEDGSMVYAVRVSEISEVIRGDQASSTFPISRHHTLVGTRSRGGHTFRCHADHIWELLNAREGT